MTPDADHAPLIRAGATPDAVRALTAPQRLPPRDPLLARLESELAALQNQLRERDIDAESAVTAAREEGRLAGEAAYRARDEEALARLERSLNAATAQFSTKLLELDALALEINRATLADIFSPSQDLVELSARAIAHQFAALRDSVIVELRVSTEDFSSEASIAALRQRLGTDTAIHIDPSLDAGDARIGLDNGGVELSLHEHRQALEALYARMAAP